MQTMMQMSMQTMATLRGRTTTLTINNNTNDNAATQTTADNVDNNDAAADVKAATKTTM